MKTMGVWAMIFVLLAGIMTECGNKPESKTDSTEDKLKIVCTIFPEYDWLCEVVGEEKDNFEIELLLDNGTDLHNYQPTAKDMADIATCDMFIYAGGESAAWVDDALENVGKDDVKVLKLCEILEGHLQEEEHIEGMADGHDHHSEECEIEGHDHEAEHHHDSETAYDEHVWLSLKNAQIIVQEIEEAVGEMDVAHKEEYQVNSEAYLAQLLALDEQFAETIEASEKDTILVADRFPFLYLVKDYGLQYYAAFSGCSAETESSFETITFLMEKVDALDLSSVLVIENSDHRLAETIVANTKEKNQEVLVLNSLQSITKKEIENGVTYLSVMEDNLEVLEKALN